MGILNDTQRAFQAEIARLAERLADAESNVDEARRAARWISERLIDEDWKLTHEWIVERWPWIRGGGT